MTSDDVVKLLMDRKRESLDAWINGHPRYDLFSPEKVTLMNPFGGYSKQGNESVRPMQNRALSNFERGDVVGVELVHAVVSGDVACLAAIERAQVKFAGQD